MVTWDFVTLRVLQLPCHKDMRIKKSEICHPKYDGFQLNIGEPQGQLADYRKLLEDGRGLHIREYIDHYRIHWDKIHPINLIGHLIEDAPHWILICLLAAIIGIPILSALAKSK